MCGHAGKVISHSPTDQTQAPALLCLPEHNLHLLGEPQGFTGKEEPSGKGRGCERLNTLSHKWISHRALVKVRGGYKVWNSKLFKSPIRKGAMRTNYLITCLEMNMEMLHLHKGQHTAPDCVRPGRSWAQLGTALPPLPARPKAWGSSQR